MAAKESKRKSGKKKESKTDVSALIKDTTAGWITDLRYGQTVSVSFFRKNAWLLILFVAIVIALIGVKYKTRTKMAEVNALEKELMVSQSNMLREKSAYMTLIRETEMLRLVDKNGMGLVFQEEPPYDVELVDN